MKKICLLIILSFTTFINPTFSQEKIIECITDEMFLKSIEEDPSVFENKKRLDEFVKNFIKEGKDKDQILIIPVVFHIVHNYGPENISKEQIFDQMRILNEDYRKTNPDTSEVVDTFKFIHADIEVEFRLAQIDPDGNCTEGIVRHYSELTYDARNNVKYEFPPWPIDIYANIWVVHDIHNDGDGTINGFAQFPGGSSSTDGIVLRYGATGSIEASNADGRTLPHEFGHYFGLYHPWGLTSCGDAGNCNYDDDIEDTPNTIGNCSTCDLTRNSCIDGWDDMIDNVQNAMDYATCGFMFTYGQRDVIRAVLNSAVSSRNNLWTDENLILTGTNDGYEPQPCSPIADFSTYKLQGCVNYNFDIIDYSYNGNVENRTWIFEGGNPSTSNDSVVTVAYENPGIYDITLIVENEYGSDTLIKSDFIKIIDTYAGYSSPMMEEFEDSNFPENSLDESKSWSLKSEGNSIWHFTDASSAFGSGSVGIKNYLNADGIVNLLISPNINLRENNLTELSFKLAFSKRTSASNGHLKVYLSDDCGQSWKKRYDKIGTPLTTNNGEIVAETFYPEDNEWREENVIITGFTDADHLMIKFENISYGGNYLYIDDIKTVSESDTTNSVLPYSNITDFQIYPNPFDKNATISFELTSPEILYISIINGLGISVGSISEYYSGGLNKINLKDVANFKAVGVYYIKITSSKSTITKRFVKL